MERLRICVLLFQLLEEVVRRSHLCVLVDRLWLVLLQLGHVALAVLRGLFKALLCYDFVVFLHERSSVLRLALRHSRLYVGRLPPAVVCLGFVALRNLGDLRKKDVLVFEEPKLLRKLSL